MIHPQWLLLLLALLFSENLGAALQSPRRKPGMAILPFEFHGDASLSWIPNGFPELLESKFFQPEYFREIRLVDRNRINASVKEMELSGGGFVDEDVSIEAGKMVGAQFIVTGSVACVGPKTALITAKLIKVETSELATITTTGPIKELYKSLPDSTAGKLFHAFKRLVNTEPQPATADPQPEKPGPVSSRPDEKRARPASDCPSVSRLGNEKPSIEVPEPPPTPAGNVVSANSASATVNFYLGVDELKKGNHRQAISAFKEAVQLDPEFARAYVNLGVAHLYQRQYDRAREYFTKSLGIFPESELAHYNLGLVHAHTGDLNGAIAEFRMAIQINPDNCETHIELGKTFYKLKDFDRAAEQYRKALAIDSLYVSAFYYLGVIDWQQGQPEAARRAWERALARNEPYFAETKMLAHKRLGFYYLYAKKAPQPAIENYLEAVKIIPPALSDEERGDLYFELGKAYLENREPARAVVPLETAASLLPNNAGIRLSFALALIGAKQSDRAVEELEMVKQLDREGKHGKSAGELLRKQRDR